MSEVEAILSNLDQGWFQDRKDRAEPGSLTNQFHVSVPVLRYLDWRVQHTARGFAETVLPLNTHSTNQHITHQAAVMLIAADYTGGVALGTLLHQVPLIGIHAPKNDYGAYLWGAKADIRWIRPSTDDLMCIATIPKARHQSIVRRFFKGRRVLETVQVEMKNGDELVAVANITYWVQDTYGLRKDSCDEKKIHVLLDHRLKASARLIAGLRALEQDKAVRLFIDPFAKKLAGKHGIILARRFCLVAPQIQPMVAARTKHLDDLILDFAARGPFQFINIGVGLDSRVLRLKLPEQTKIFEIDLPSMLRSRDEMLAPYRQARTRTRFPIPLDLLRDDVGPTVLACPEFDADLPTLVAWEGGSMYFAGQDSRRIIQSAISILKNPNSRLWMDYVDHSVVDGTAESVAVHDFTNAMRSLGEPFVNGFGDLPTDLKGCGLEIIQDQASVQSPAVDDPVYSLYRFCIARPEAVQ